MDIEVLSLRTTTENNLRNIRYGGAPSLTMVTVLCVSNHLWCPICLLSFNTVVSIESTEPTDDLKHAMLVIV